MCGTIFHYWDGPSIIVGKNWWNSNTLPAIPVLWRLGLNTFCPCFRVNPQGIPTSRWPMYSIVFLGVGVSRCASQFLAWSLDVATVLNLGAWLVNSLQRWYVCLKFCFWFGGPPKCGTHWSGSWGIWFQCLVILSYSGDILREHWKMNMK